MQDFMDAVKNRRTYYGISKASTVSIERIEEIISDAVKYAPSPFNSQSARVVLLLGTEHDRFWELTRDELRKVVPEAKFAPTDQKITSFASGFGTVLYFEDSSVVEGLQKQFPAYKDNFPIWSHHSSGMLQFIIWTALEAEGLGASLQHYAPLIDHAVRSAWNIPANWQLIAQMPFGKPVAEPGPKDFSPLDARFKVYK